MSKSYSHHHRQHKQHNLKLGIVVLSVLASVGVIVMVGMFIYNDLRLNQSEAVEGQERTVSQVLGNTDTKFIDEQNFSFELPGDWREIDRATTDRERSITWQATLRNEDNRYLTLHINTIPDDAVVRLLPVTVNGSRMQRGQLSGNCSSFTGLQEQSGSRSLARWEDVDFVCDTSNRVNTNIIGTGQGGQPQNTIEVTGESSGTNQYFFLYKDQNIRPNFDILYSAVNSFRAK